MLERTLLKRISFRTAQRNAALLNAFRRRLVVACRPIVVAALAAAMSAGASGAPTPVHLSVDAHNFSYPYASETDNRAAFAQMMKGSQVLGHYHRFETHTRFEMVSCMTGVVCFPSPHFETQPEWRDRTLAVVPAVTPSPDGLHWRLDFSLPAQDKNGTLDLVTLVLPLADLWNRPSVQEAVRHAVATQPDYEDYKAAQEDKTVEIDLIVPKVAGVGAPYQRYCPAINNPRSYSHSGEVSLRLDIPEAIHLHSEGDILKWRADKGQCADSPAD